MKDVTKTTKEDFGYTTAKAVVSAIPILGGPAAEFLNLVVGEPAQKRRDEFCQQLYDRIVGLEGQFEQLSPENLAANAQFQATFIECAQVAARTVRDDKRQLLQNAILNVAVSTNIDETVRALLVSFVERLTIDHVRLLKVYDDPLAIEAVRERLKSIMAGGGSIVVEAALPDLARNGDLAKILLSDLRSMNLMEDPGFNTTMTPNGIGSRRSTSLGRTLLSFLSDPGSGSLPLSISSTATFT